MVMRELTYQPLEAHWADRLRDTYWQNPTKAQALALFVAAVTIGAVAVAIINQ
jgi:hypothetical protein